MEKNYILFNVDNNKYWTGRYWDNPYSIDIRDAKIFATEELLIEELSTTEEDNPPLKKLLNTVNMFDVRIVYICNIF